ncbi:energy transducer TonB [Adhaeribacter terreus]|uniref:Energy transducer TonB n=1 Tax=Adhaeribacter terreus TaxID=529703 RepID=A0ABW0EBN9_9BACT
MKRLLLFACFLIAFFTASAQIRTTDEQVYSYADPMPEFPGGQTKMMEYIAQNIRYPGEALVNGLQGIVFVSFVVEKNGKITQVETIKSAAPSLDAEAVRVCESMPNWEPGKLNNQTVAVKFTLPIRFQFQTKDQTDSTAIIERVEEQPEFPGGQEAMFRFLATHIKYPKEAQKERIQGRSIISFVVNQDGSLSNYKIVKRLGYGADEEALRVLQAMPLWKPGKINGKPVRVKFTLPVLFQL